MNITSKKIIIDNLNEKFEYSAIYGSRRETVNLTRTGISGYTSSGGWMSLDFKDDSTLYDQIHGVYLNKVIFEESNNGSVSIDYSCLNAIIGVSKDLLKEIDSNIGIEGIELKVKIGSNVKDRNLGLGIVVSDIEIFDNRKTFKVKFIDEDEDKLEIFDIYGRHFYTYDDTNEWSRYLSLGLYNEC